MSCRLDNDDTRRAANGYFSGSVAHPAPPHWVLKPMEIKSALLCVLASNVILFSVRSMLASSENTCAYAKLNELLSHHVPHQFRL